MIAQYIKYLAAYRLDKNTQPQNKKGHHLIGHVLASLYGHPRYCAGALSALASAVASAGAAGCAAAVDLVPK